MHTWGAGGDRRQGSLSQKHRENGLAELPSRLRTWASPQDCPENSELHASLKLFSFMDQLVMTREQWMYKAGRKLLAVRGWEEFQGSWGLNASVSLQVGKWSLLSVFTQLFLFEQQPLWLWCKNKLIPKPLLAMSWLSVYCLSTHTEKRGKLVSFHEVISVLISMLRCFLYMKNKNAPLSWRNLIFLASWDQQLCYFALKFFKKLIYLNWRIITIFWWVLPHITWISFFKESSKVILFLRWFFM